MVEAGSRQFPLRRLFWLTFGVGLMLAVWLPDVDELAWDHEVAAILVMLARVILGAMLLMAAGRHVRLMPRFVRRLPLELQFLTGLMILLVVLIAAAILLPPIG